jgi:hypothetical protein
MLNFNNTAGSMTYQSAVRKRRMFKMGKRICMGLIFFDAWVSYVVIRELSGDSMFAIAMAAGIGVSQWIVSEAIFGARFSNFFALDANMDGSVSIDEYFRFGAKIITFVVLYFIDIITNISSIDSFNFGRLIWVFPGVPDTEQSAYIFSLLCAVLLTFLDELLMVVIDGSEEAVESQMPNLTVQQAARVGDQIKADRIAGKIIDRANQDKTKI